MERIYIGDYEIVLTGRGDGSACSRDHWVHDVYYSVTQTHSDVVYFLKEKKKPGQDFSVHADAIVAPVSLGASLGIYTADCNPVVFLGKKYMAVLHGSWKTLKMGIVEKTVNILGKKGEDFANVYVYIGPSIRKQVYEVGLEFYDIFPSSVLEERGGSLYLDLVAYIRQSLEKIGVVLSNIHIHPDCTYQNNDKRFSWRRNKTKQRNFCGVSKVK